MDERDPGEFVRSEDAFRDGDGRGADPVSVPVLGDTRTGRIVSNADDDLMRMLTREFDAFTDRGLGSSTTGTCPAIFGTSTSSRGSRRR